MDVNRAKEEVIRAGRELMESGLIARTWGNVSCRTDEAHFVISATGRDYRTLTEDEVIEMDMRDLSYRGSVKPSSEKRVHSEIYKLREEVGFIVHTHQHNASAVSAMKQPAIKLDREYPGLGEFVLCAEYGLPGSSRVSDKVAEAVQESVGQAVIMSNHGAVCFGRDREEAFEIANTLEEACGKYLAYIGVDPWDGEDEHYRQQWNSDPVILKYIDHSDELPAYLDDFAQMVGARLRVYEPDERTPLLIGRAFEENVPILIRGRGAMCNAGCEDDRTALSMLIEKNCRAALAGLGCNPIGKYECIFMRQNYLQKYSKLKDKGESHD